MLVVFLLLSANVVSDGALPVDLPMAETAEDIVNEVTRLTITSDGLLFINGDAIGLDQLSTAIDSASRVIVEADTTVEHGRVVAVVDRLRAHGVSSLYYATTEEESW